MTSSYELFSRWIFQPIDPSAHFRVTTHFFYLCCSVWSKKSSTVDMKSSNINFRQRTFQPTLLGSHTFSISVALLGSQWSKKSPTADTKSSYENFSLWTFQPTLLSPYTYSSGVAVLGSHWSKVINSWYEVIIRPFKSMNFSAHPRRVLKLSN